MKLSPGTQWPMYEMEDLFGGFEDEQEAQGAAADKIGIWHFATAAAATAAAGAYTAQGGVLTDGMTRTVAGYLQTYRGGQWGDVMPHSYQLTSFFATTWGGSEEIGVAQLNIPDQGQPYFIDASAQVNVAANSGVDTTTVIRVDGTGGPFASAAGVRDGRLPDGGSVTIPLLPYRVGPFSGAHSLIVTVKRNNGTGQWAVPAGGNLLRADIVFP